MGIAEILNLLDLTPNTPVRGNVLQIRTADPPKAFTNCGHYCEYLARRVSELMRRRFSAPGDELAVGLFVIVASHIMVTFGQPQLRFSRLT